MKHCIIKLLGEPLDILLDYFEFRPFQYYQYCYLSGIKGELKAQKKYFNRADIQVKTIGIYFDRVGVPIYIHRKDNNLGIEYLVVVTAHLKYLYEIDAEEYPNRIKQGIQKDQKKTQRWTVLPLDPIEKERLRVEKAEKRAIKQVFLKKREDFLMNNWLTRYRHNAIEWKETFEPQEAEIDKLLMLMEKKKLD